ncbi:MAG: cation:proton antiporter, partial [Sulfurovaceae bacterium]|nr:cation:proton antiporter [Sulfurovaceae bacterium]
MDSTVTHILTLSLLLVFSPHISRFLSLQTAPVEIIVGSILGYINWIGGDNKGSHYFDLVAEVGFLYLMFLAGLEINLKSIIKIPKSHILKSINFLIVVILITPIVGHFIFKFNYIITVALPLISVGLLATLSKEYDKADWINITLLIGAIGEVLSITALTILEVSIAVGFSTEFISKISILFIFLVAILILYYLFRLIFWWYPELKNKIMPPLNDNNQDFRIAIGIFFFMIVVMKILHLELAFGAFIAGLFISTFFH